MRVAMAPMPMSGYGAAVPRTAPFEETTSIWYTPQNYDNAEEAIQAAAEQAESFMMAGYVLTGIGMEPVSFDPDLYRGYITSTGDIPPGAQPVEGVVEKPPWWHYGLAAGGGIVVGIVVGALVGLAAK